MMPSNENYVINIGDNHYGHGSINAIMMGAGMSLVMTHIDAIIGLNGSRYRYPYLGYGHGMSAYRILNFLKKKYADKIVELSDKIIQG